MKFKDNQSIQDVVNKVKRSFLIRCFKEVSKQYPPVINMSPEEGADELLRLEMENEISIELSSERDIINCHIHKYHLNT